MLIRQLVHFGICSQDGSAQVQDCHSNSIWGRAAYFLAKRALFLLVYVFIWPFIDTFGQRGSHSNLVILNIIFFLQNNAKTMLMVHNGRQRRRKVHIAPGAVFITSWIPPVLAILRTSTSTTLLASLSMPTTSIALCLNRKAFRPLAESPRAGPDRFRLQAKVGKNLAHANSLELQKSECWHCGNQFKFLSCSVAGADRSLDKW